MQRIAMVNIAAVLPMPRMSGLDVLRTLRPINDVPVSIMTACDALEQRIEGLDLGADDYLTKPFDLAELKARLRAVIRRSQGRASAEITCQDVIRSYSKTSEQSRRMDSFIRPGI